MEPRARTMTVKEAAQWLGVTEAAVRAKIRHESLRPIGATVPTQFWTSDVAAYRAARARAQVPTWGGTPTATQVLRGHLQRIAPRPAALAELVQVLHAHGIGRHWQLPRNTCCTLLRRPGFRRLRRGWYTVAAKKRSAQSSQT
jgi:hypothetical protein